jgi:hypothetical protein
MEDGRPPKESTTTAMDRKQDAVLTEQYRMLREEVMILIDETRKIETYVIGGIAAYYGWLVTNSVASQPVWFVATALALFGGFRSLGLFVRVGDIARYLREIEAHWGHPVGNLRLPGWERHFLHNNTFPLSWVTFSMWTILICLTLIAPFVLAPAPKEPKPIKVEIVDPAGAKQNP